MFEGVRYSSLAIFNKEELHGEWHFFKRAFFQEKKVMMEKNTSPPSLQDIKGTMETSYTCIFPETFKMMNFFLAFPICTASVERSFSHLIMIKTRLCSHLSECSVAQLMRISIEGPELDAAEFEEMLEIFNGHNHRILH